MKYYEAEATSEILEKLLQLSAQWAAEQNCYGYYPNTEADIRGKRIFLAEDEDGIEAYLLGEVETAKNMKSIMPEGTLYFEAEELYVVPEKRSQGIGEALFRFVEETVKKDVQFIMLSTASKNSKAILHFYLDELDMQFWSARLFKKVRE
jgi:hypothetical protein